MKKPIIRPFEILENTRSGELGLVIEVGGGKVVMADRSGNRAIYKLTDEFVKVADRDGFAMATLAAMRQKRHDAAAAAKQASLNKRRATLAAKKAAKAA